VEIKTENIANCEETVSVKDKELSG